MIGAGPLDRKVTIQRIGGAQDAFGQPVKSFTDIATVPCKKRDLLSTSTLEADIADQEQTKTISEFTIRYYPGLEGKYRLKFENEVYEIVRIAERGRKRYTLIMAYALSSEILD
jgi:head-tail adaptor